MGTRQNNIVDDLTVITTHLNADFDAVGSMLAAHKLYPGSLVILPGFHERNSKNFFVNSMAYLFNMVNIKEIDIKTTSILRRVLAIIAMRKGNFVDAKKQLSILRKDFPDDSRAISIAIEIAVMTEDNDLFKKEIDNLMKIEKPDLSEIEMIYRMLYNRAMWDECIKLINRVIEIESETLIEGVELIKNI